MRMEPGIFELAALVFIVAAVFSDKIREKALFGKYQGN